MDRFQEWLTFVRVVEAGSFSQAGQRLNIAKSAVSRRINDLEQRLGAQLLNRSTRRISLTETGRDFYERCRRILDDMQEAETLASTDYRDLQGTLRIAASVSFGFRHLAPAMVDFLHENPGITIDLDVNDRQVNLIEAGFDMAIRIANLDDSTLRARALAPIRMVAVASPAYLEAHGRPMRPEDLSGHKGLRYSVVPERQTWGYRDPSGATKTLRLSTRLHASNGDVLLAAAIGGLGVLVIPCFVAHEAIEDGSLEVLLPDVEWNGLTAYAVYPAGRHLSPRVRAFIDFLTERFGEDPYWDRFWSTLPNAVPAPQSA
ncbi:MAG: LysR family transcriptional regulator [Pseudomonadota bacterium]